MRIAVFVIGFLVSLSVFAQRSGNTYASVDSIQIEERLFALAKVKPSDTVAKASFYVYAYSKSKNYTRGALKSLLLNGQTHTFLNRSDEALRSYLRGLNEARKFYDSTYLAQLYWAIGTIYELEGFDLKALEYMLMLEKMNPQYASATVQGILPFKIGEAYLALQNPAMAIPYFTRALENDYYKQNPKQQLPVYQSLISAYKMIGQYSDAITYNKQLIDLTETLQLPNETTIAYNNLGYLYKFTRQFDKAADFLQQTLTLKKQQNQSELSLAPVLVNLGIVYQNNGQYKEALQSLSEAYMIVKKLGNKQDLARLEDLLAVVYFNLRDEYNALTFNEISIQTATYYQLPEVLADCYKTASIIHQENERFELALDYFKKYLSLQDSLAFSEKLKQQALLQQQFLVERTEKELQLLLVSEEIKDLTIKQLQLERENQQRENELLRKEKQLANEKAINKELEAKRALQALMIKDQQLKAAQKDNEIARLELVRENQALELREKELRERQITSANQLLQKDNQIKKLQIEQDQTFRQYALFIGGLGFLSLVLILVGLLITRRNNRILASKNEQIKQSQARILEEMDKSEKLLLNILPAATAEELKTEGHATPQAYELVTVLFCDFEGFTKIAEKMSPKDVLMELDYCFGAFDEIIEKYGMEKIKTMGDAYMCAGGVPRANTTNPVDVTLAALDMLDFMER